MYFGDVKMAESVMEDSLIMEKLRNVDKELHSIMDELEVKKHNESLSLSELNKVMERDRISDEDSTELIRKMRDKEYNL